MKGDTIIIFRGKHKIKYKIMTSAYLGIAPSTEGRASKEGQDRPKLRNVSSQPSVKPALAIQKDNGQSPPPTSKTAPVMNTSDT